MVDENERLLAVIADMRREMDALRDMSQRQSAELRHSQSKAGPTIAELEQVTRALEEANTHRQEQQQRLEEVLRDNRRMTDENHKLKGNCVRPPPPTCS
jgi:septal ring factor EnvC (AmiA/AmiB activator)